MKKQISQAEADRQIQGGEVLGPGLWQDKEGGIHFSLPEMLSHIKLPDTPENRALLTRVIMDFVTSEHPEAEIIQQNITNVANN